MCQKMATGSTVIDLRDSQDFKNDNNFSWDTAGIKIVATTSTPSSSIIIKSNVMHDLANPTLIEEVTESLTILFQDNTGNISPSLRKKIQDTATEYIQYGNLSSSNRKRVNSIVNLCYKAIAVDEAIRLSSSSAKLESISSPSTSLINLTTSPTALTSSLSSSSSSLQFIKTPVQQIQVVFPDVEETYALKTLMQYNNEVESAIQDLAEKGYVKRSVNSAIRISKPITIDYTSLSWETTQEYRSAALLVLNNDFPFVTKHSMKMFFAAKKHHYFHTVEAIESELKVSRGEINRPLNSTKIESVRIGMTKLGIQLRNTFKLEAIPPGSMDEMLSSEIAWMRRRRDSLREARDWELAEKINNELAGESGGFVECGCCYNDVMFEKAVQCSEGHLFCKICLQHYVEETVFGNGRSVLMCIGMGQCEGFFPDSMVKICLPGTTYLRYQEAVAREAVKQAKIQLVSCYSCSLQVEMAEDAGSVMTCPGCYKETCRLCSEEAHVPLRCSEVEKKAQTDTRLTVEEAMTQARLRCCHKCRAKFFKSEGCNKMTCACGAIICYICCKSIDAEKYKHFCQTPHCDHKNCGKCQLFTDWAEDDRRAMLEAGMKALESATTQHPSTAESTVEAPSVNVVALLEGGALNQKPPAIARAQAATNDANLMRAMGAHVNNQGDNPFELLQQQLNYLQPQIQQLQARHPMEQRAVQARQHAQAENQPAHVQLQRQHVLPAARQHVRETHVQRQQGINARQNAIVAHQLQRQHAMQARQNYLQVQLQAATLRQQELQAQNHNAVALNHGTAVQQHEKLQARQHSLHQTAGSLMPQLPPPASIPDIPPSPIDVGVFPVARVPAIPQTLVAALALPPAGTRGILPSRVADGAPLPEYIPGICPGGAETGAPPPARISQAQALKRVKNF